jgi:hypothetical protein
VEIIISITFSVRLENVGKDAVRVDMAGIFMPSAVISVEEVTIGK